MSPSRQLVVDEQSSPRANEDRVCAIVVTHQPDCDGIARQLVALRRQVERVLIVDNASDDAIRKQLRQIAASPAQLIELPENIGVGAAHNIGIRTAKKSGCSHVLLLDHDSVPDEVMVDHLLDGLRSTEKTNRVAAVGPLYRDPRTGREGRFIRHQKSVSDAPEGLTAVDFLITSGSLIPLAVFDDIGLFDEGLFVDYVDTEWCLRAIASGYRLFGVQSATMFHTIGDDISHTCGFAIPAYSPRRLYYQARNPFLIGNVLRVRTLLRILRLCLYYGLLQGPRVANLRMLWRGLRDGLSGRRGRVDVAADPKLWEKVLHASQEVVKEHKPPQAA